MFRDREISDRIGFAYAFGEARPGVEDLIGRIRHAGRLGAAARADGGEPPLVSVILDGENPWESYPGAGEPFLEGLFTALEQDREVGAVAIGQHLAAHPARATLTRLHSGSWIDSDFHIWIADPVKNRAWELLLRARKRWQRAVDDAGDKSRSDAGLSAGRIEEAYGHLLAAEGSDWFWWFGEPFHSAEDATFDRLFRAHLAAAWSALGESVPAELGEPVARGGPSRQAQPPRGLISPTIDGKINRYFDWVDAGRYEVPRGAAMAEGPVFTTLHFGFDERTLYLRLDPAPDARARLRGAALEVTIVDDAREVQLSAPLAAEHFSLRDRGTPDGGDDVARPWRDLGQGGVLGFGEVVELSVPFASLQLAPGARIEFMVQLHQGEVALGRFPRDGRLSLTVPDKNFAADHWRV